MRVVVDRLTGEIPNRISEPALIGQFNVPVFDIDSVRYKRSIKILAIRSFNQRINKRGFAGLAQSDKHELATFVQDRACEQSFQVGYNDHTASFANLRRWSAYRHAIAHIYLAYLGQQAQLRANAFEENAVYKCKIF